MNLNQTFNRVIVLTVGGLFLFSTVSPVYQAILSINLTGAPATDTAIAGLLSLMYLVAVIAITLQMAGFNIVGKA